MSKGAYIRQDELRFMANLVQVKLNMLGLENKEFGKGAEAVTKMALYVKEYQTAQDIKAKLDKALNIDKPAPDLINPDA